MASLSESQTRILEVTERVGSCISVLGCAWIFVTFVSSAKFRKPINRLIFFASLGNLLCNVATLISQDGIRAGTNSSLCQLQAFLIQMCLPADAMWNLCMAINVYLTVFKKYSSADLRRLEWMYLVGCYIPTFIVALAYCFISTPERGRVYGPALTWCSISIGWNFLRIALCYGPAWVCILTTFTIYILSGREIFKKREQLRAFSHPVPSITKLEQIQQGEPYEEIERIEEVEDIENPFKSFKTTEVHITSEAKPNARNAPDMRHNRYETGGQQPQASDKGYIPYSVTIERGIGRPQPPVNHNSSRRQNRAAMEANTTALRYLKCAVLFFLSLLVTWVPSSINRVYSLVHPTTVSFTFNYMGGLVLPLMGFWNAVIYTTISWEAVKRLFGGFSWPLSSPRFSGVTNGCTIAAAIEVRKPISLSSGEVGGLPIGRLRDGSDDSFKRLAGSEPRNVH